ncbi:MULTISPECIES: PilZ domain-containing protein [Rhizobium]|uniref:PilZ domain-containing protein n=1 Tax=Rhizobium rhododendri TaxID=2506430 RepID=A0ABY8IM11_9HYPH|nr:MULTISPECIES: PilZ domain-containing protein [Rhizobium]MBZ5758063.1 PilZ domain-containing protein [Rhizobium sp. VS19-DR96]MBZ5765107.1 PilZ domain-containing protein [Rhizobium sp. VS19-DR129.2]MBZ5772650.1 PilZ domain-containing protein [Rhizobium sp. VS19-DRK62.2]MBZ5782663.1 PilZ domain-containing protein [Rhizobium sp. VS19-DR121]MBZ5800111.1 PilZ domain-containing protein [Rhizobium sp. VS19-DR181]
MHSFQPAMTTRSAPRMEQRTFQRVPINMQGRLMLANYDEFECMVVDMSPGDLYVTCEGRPRANERVIAYIDHLGRIEGLVISVDNRGFNMSINATDRKREKLAAQLTWLANKHELGLPEDRRHDRLTPKSATVELTLEDGSVYNCRLMDLSLSGAAVDVEARPALGMAVRLGNMRGRIVRHFREGVAIEFLSLQSRDTLREFL